MLISGTATDQNDLLSQLTNWLVGTVGWTSLKQTLQTGAQGISSVSLQAPGASSGQVFLNFDTENNVAAAQYGIVIRGATAFSPGLPAASQLNVSPAVYLNLWQNAMSWWAYANDRRVIIIVRCSTVYVSAYAGFFLPWGTPAQYPFPLVVAGDNAAPCVWSYSNSGRRMMCDPGATGSGSSMWVRNPTGIWIPGHNQVASANNDQVSGPMVYEAAQVWPWAVGVGSTQGARSSWAGFQEGEASGGGLDQMVPTRQQEIFVWATMLLSSTESPFGTLDGVFCAPGASLSSETIVNAGGRTFRAFQNIARTSGNDFFVVEEI